MRIIKVTTETFGARAAEALARAMEGLDRPVLGLPTGRTPVPLYEYLDRQHFTFPAGTDAFALDEYCWPDATQPGTNASFFARYWPRGQGVPWVQIPRADAPDPVAEIERYRAALEEWGGLDVALLGIGANGHIAFNEPGSGRDSTCRVVDLADETRRAALDIWPEPPSQGMTVGVREIMDARRVVLLATGAGKRDILHRALCGPVASDVPASFLQEHPRLVVVCDEAAGAGLPPC
jgi:glucosamine-6-phosphate deaminase